MIHQMDAELISRRVVERCHNVHLLNLIRVGFCPCVVFPGGVISRVNLCIHIPKLGRIICSVTVTDGICAPPLYKLQCLRNTSVGIVTRPFISAFSLIRISFHPVKNFNFFLPVRTLPRAPGTLVSLSIAYAKFRHKSIAFLLIILYILLFYVSFKQ